MQIQAVIFDRDNTLLQPDPAAVAALEARYVEIVPTLPRYAAAAHWSEWPGPWPNSEDEEPAFWRTFYGELVARFELPQATTAELQTIGASYHTCFSAFPDALPCLRALRDRGLRLAVLTNFELPSVHLTIRHAGLDPGWFAALLSSSILGVSKPDLHAYLAAAAALDVPPSSCAFVDDLVVNVEAACAVGMRGILLDRQHTEVSCTTERVFSLDGLLELLTPL